MKHRHNSYFGQPRELQVHVDHQTDDPHEKLAGAAMVLFGSLLFMPHVVRYGWESLTQKD